MQITCTKPDGCERLQSVRAELDSYQKCVENSLQQISKLNVRYENLVNELSTILNIFEYINLVTDYKNLFSIINDMLIGVLGATNCTIFIENNGEYNAESSNLSRVDLKNMNNIGKLLREKYSDNREPVILSAEDINDEVLDALRYFKPIVALESTIISHGMPYPDNLKTAEELETIVRQNGATPATIAIIDGRIKIGLTPEELQYLAQSKDIIKVSRRDIPYVIAMGKSGATTVASTMIFAQMAGIRVFATGGIGGVHRGAETTFDVSADLTELSQTNVAVVCAGVKSILDIGLTLEKLETLGVPVLGYQTDEFPSFYTRKSGFGVDYRIDKPEDCAKLLKTKWELGLDGGVIIANPIPSKFEADQDKIDKAIKKAVEESVSKNVRGKEVTPFLLAKIKELTGGESLESNIALVKHNTEVAAKIAVQYAELDNN